MPPPPPPRLDSPPLDPQVFYEIHSERERQGLGTTVAIVRVEQLAPFPFDLVSRELYRWGRDWGAEGPTGCSLLGWPGMAAGWTGHAWLSV
jgi:hypothetical protein